MTLGWNRPLSGSVRGDALRFGGLALSGHTPHSPVRYTTTNGLIIQCAKKRLLACSCFSKGLTQRKGFFSFVGVFLLRRPLGGCQHLAASERGRGVDLAGLGSET